MEEILQHLERKLRKLVAEHTELRQAHEVLHQGTFVLTREKQRLLAKQDKAISQIQILLSKLKTMETLP